MVLFLLGKIYVYKEALETLGVSSGSTRDGFASILRPEKEENISKWSNTLMVYVCLVGKIRSKIL